MVLSDLIAPSADVRETFDALHRRIDPSHHRAHLEAELVALLPDGYELSYGATASAAAAGVDRLHRAVGRRRGGRRVRAELAGGPATGFEPSDDDGELVVAFWTSTVHASWPHALSRR